MSSLHEPRQNPYLRKLLSHRLRGFDAHEQSRAGMQRVGDFDVPFIELDARADRDGIIYIHHDPHYISPSGKKYKLSDTSTTKLEEFAGENSTIVTLSNALEIFRQHSKPTQKICIDIKDIGYEATYIEAVKLAKLESRTIFISWAPQVLSKLSTLGCKSPLILSCWHLRRLSWLGRLVSNFMHNRIICLGSYVLFGSGRALDELPGLKTGFQHALLTCAIPPQVTIILSSSNGGICVHRTLLSASLVEMCRMERLQLWIYSVTSTEQFVSLASIQGVDVVFSDAAASTARQLSD